MIFIPACLQLTCFVNEWVAVVSVCYICVEPFKSLIHKFVFWSVGGPYFVNENPLCWLVWIFLVLYLNVASFIFKLFFLWMSTWPTNKSRKICSVVIRTKGFFKWYQDFRAENRGLILFFFLCGFKLRRDCKERGDTFVEV